MTVHRILPAVAILVAAPAFAGCGTSSSSKSTAPPSTSGAATATAPTPSVAPATTTSAQTPSPGALQAEANAAATGDIPDSQVFLAFVNARAGWSMKYPEGWAQSGSGTRVAFRERNNAVRIVIASGSAPTIASVEADLSKLAGVRIQGAPQSVALPAGQAVEVVYTTQPGPNPVTGKRVTLAVDRYYVGPHAGKVAIVDLGTPQGVDNVDAYRLMIKSFRWR